MILPYLRLDMLEKISKEAPTKTQFNVFISLFIYLLFLHMYVFFFLSFTLPPIVSKEKRHHSTKRLTSSFILISNTDDIG